MADCQISRKEERIINAAYEWQRGHDPTTCPGVVVQFEFRSEREDKKGTGVPFCEQHTRGVRRAYFNSATTTTGSGELFMANSDSNLLFGN